MDFPLFLCRYFISLALIVANQFQSKVGISFCEDSIGRITRLPRLRQQIGAKSAIRSPAEILDPVLVIAVQNPANQLLWSVDLDADHIFDQQAMVLSPVHPTKSTRLRLLG